MPTQGCVSELLIDEVVSLDTHKTYLSVYTRHVKPVRSPSVVIRSLLGDVAAVFDVVLAQLRNLRQERDRSVVESESRHPRRDVCPIPEDDSIFVDKPGWFAEEGASVRTVWRHGSSWENRAHPSNATILNPWVYIVSTIVRSSHAFCNQAWSVLYRTSFPAQPVRVVGKLEKLAGLTTKVAACFRPDSTFWTRCLSRRAC